MPGEIVIIGLGPGSPDALSLGALRAFRRLRDLHAPILARTLRHPTVAWLEMEEGIVFTASYDQSYDTLNSFEEVYESIARDLLDRATQDPSKPVGYCVPGHPRFGETAVELLRRQVSETYLDVVLTFAPSASYVDAVLEASESAEPPIRILDALALIQPPPNYSGETEPLAADALHLVYQVYDRSVASEVKLALLEIYPPDAPVTIVTAAGVPGEERRVRRTLAEVDRAGVEFDHLTTLLVPPLDSPELATSYEGLLEIMARLRNPEGGCPWDREQTPDSLRRYLLEEAYEVLEAIDSGDDGAYAEELGDLLLQVVFHAQLAREDGRFTMRDVIRAVTSKLVRRHPHVFGEVQVGSSEQVLANWAAIKKTEKGYETRESILDGVPRALPALMRAQEISRRAAKSGFEWGSIEGVFDKLAEEIAELREAIASGDANAVESEMGDLLFTAVNLARFQKVEAEDALGRMVERFSGRFRRIEEHARAQERVLTDLSQAEMEQVWQLAKRE